MQYSREGKSRRVTQLRKGILELAVMGTLSEKRHYGYSLIRSLNERGAIGIKEGTIYPILSRLSRDDLVDSEWVESDQGPPRKYYALTSKGRELFDELAEELDQLVSLVRRIEADPDRNEVKGKKLSPVGGERL